MFPYLISTIDRGDVIERKIVWFEKEDMNSDDIDTLNLGEDFFPYQKGPEVFRDKFSLKTYSCLESGKEVKFLHERELEFFRKKLALKEYSYEDNNFVELVLPAPVSGSISKGNSVSAEVQQF